jgi:hypothetical protein
LAVALALSIVGGASIGAAEQTAPKPVAAAAPAEKKARPIPFHGTIAAVNPTAQTITVGKRVFVVTADTKLYRNDKTVAGAWKDAVVGGPVTGSYVKAPDGRLMARSVYFKPSAASGVRAGQGSAAAKASAPDE